MLVNRFWLHHFGRGIVSTPGDFGALGERPTHPELLDWLAREFMDGGWKLKPLHRLMVLSTAYRQSSRHDASLAADPENRLFGRFKIQRLEGEALRDTMLAAAGSLNRALFGEPIGIARDPSGCIVVGMEQLNANRDVMKVVSRGKEDFRRSHLCAGAPQDAAHRPGDLRRANDGAKLRSAKFFHGGAAVAAAHE